MSERNAMFAFFGILVGFKIWTLILVFTITSTWSTLGFLLASHVLWIATGIVIVWAPIAFWMRLVRVRAKRNRLQHSEWHLETGEHAPR